MLPHLQYEIELWKKGYTVIGIDEVGRGAFAGPLCVAGVIFPAMQDLNSIKRFENFGINDSKKLSRARRELLTEVIQKECLSYFISTIPVTEINRIGIGKSTFKAMRQVVKSLRETLPQDKFHLLTDAFKLKNTRGITTSNQTNLIHGDSISLSIAAASIIAKVYRDNLMKKLSTKHPQFNWQLNKGYGTLFHRNTLKQFGKTPLHRDLFVKSYI